MTSDIVTIQDVANLAGVSPSSVSNFLNGRLDRMRRDTRARIENAITTLDFRPNGAARQLKTGLVPLIGLFVPTVANPFFGELAVAVERAAQASDLHVILCNTLRDAERERSAAEELAAYGVRGLIMASALTGQEPLTGSRLRGVVRVAFDATADGAVDSISIDNEQATAVAVAHLAEIGHSRIVYATGPVGTANRSARLAGFHAETAKLGLAEAEVLIEESPGSGAAFGDLDLTDLGRRLARRIAAARPRPTAVIAVNDMLALGIIAELRLLGVDIPTDVSVVGIDDIVFASLFHPALTTVRQPLDDMAVVAIERLKARLAGDESPRTSFRFPPELIVRGTTCHPRR
jgi:DNA-binding LacI/PurR family transcriptional regulator